MPIFDTESLLGFAATRAHHADVGGDSPGSMGVHTTLDDEGVVISPSLWFRAGEEKKSVLGHFLSLVRSPGERMGDLSAQKAACATGARRVLELNERVSLHEGFDELLEASEAYGKSAIDAIPDGVYTFADDIDDDGLGNGPFHIAVTLDIEDDRAQVDFTGTAEQCDGPMNCPMPVTAAAVYYAFRCLMPAETPQTGAIFRPIRIIAPAGCLVNAKPGAAVAAGNVETSQRIVDVVLGALAQALPDRIAAASQGTMNNILFGGRNKDGTQWVYYETLAGGMGAHAGGPGMSAVQCHMTNTKNTSIEVLEMHYPLRILGYYRRIGSGGRGRHRGGEGIVREWQVLDDCICSVLSERRTSGPYGLRGGQEGTPGANMLIRGNMEQILPAKCTLELRPDDVLRIATPGGGGFGRPMKDD
jgi:N-methylhydantoinase B